MCVVCFCCCIAVTLFGIVSVRGVMCGVMCVVVLLFVLVIGLGYVLFSLVCVFLCLSCV